MIKIGASFAAFLLAASLAQAQPLTSFDELALQVNLDDRVRVEEANGSTSSGRVTRLTRDELVIRTDRGERHFTSDTVRAVAVRGHALWRSALIGAGIVGVLGSVATCAHEGGSDCAAVGFFRAVPIGAGLGAAIGAVVPRMMSVYRATDRGAAHPTAGAATSEPSLLEDLGLRVNLGDQLRVEDRSGTRITGWLVRLTPDSLTLDTTAGEKLVPRDDLRTVALRRSAIRAATVIGAGAGAIYGGIAECRGEPHSECADGLIIGAALGAGAGVLAGALINRTTVVYPAAERQTWVVPAISSRGIAVHVVRTW